MIAVRNMIKITSPLLDNKEEDAVLEVIRSGQLAQGVKVKEFEEKFAEFCNTKYAIAVSNGTTALHLALIALGIKEDDEVITTPFSFAASTNCILYLGAKPVFVDIDLKTFNIDPKLIEEKITPATKAILPVDLYGLPVQMDLINQIAKKHNLKILEDACQAHGALYKGKKTGSLTDVGCFSFYPTKNMTTGEGGIVVTDDQEIAEKVRLLREHGMKERYKHQILGFNYRMTNIAAAIGIEQLKKLPTFNEKRISNAVTLTTLLQDEVNIQLPVVPAGVTHVFHQYTILVNSGKKTRDDLAVFLNDNGVGTMVYYPIPIYKQEYMVNQYKNIELKNTQEAADKVLSLPIHPGVDKEDLSRIAELIKQFFKNHTQVH